VSIHVVSDWDGLSTPKDKHVIAVIKALHQNRAYHGRWMPAAFMVMNPSDTVMITAAMLLDICGTPRVTPEEIRIVIGQIENKDRRAPAKQLLTRVLRRLRQEEEHDRTVDQSETGG
jgi:hypothetical protein